jgi:ribose transport system substrate-binding protein
MLSKVLWLLVLVLLLNACAENSPAASSPTLGQLRVAIIPPSFTSPFHVGIKNSTLSAGAKLGWQVDVVAPQQEDDFAGQVTVMEQEIEKQVAAISVNPIDANAIVVAVKRANQAQIPVFMHNLITPLNTGDVVEYIGYDQWNGAAKLGTYACKLLQGKGSVFILTGISGFHTKRRTDGFKAALAQNCPDVSIVGEQSAQWEREKAISVATVALQQYPDIKLFYGNSDEMDIGACEAAKKMGRQINKDIFCIGIDGNPVTLESIAKGEVTATLGVYPDKIGETVIKQMAKYLQREKIPQILETPSLVVDASNLEQYKSGVTWTEPQPGKPEYDNAKPSGN